MDQVLQSGATPSRIVYAHPCKQISFLQYARKMNIDLMTFDSESELHKIHSIYPDARWICRKSIFVKQYQPRTQMRTCTSAPTNLRIHMSTHTQTHAHTHRHTHTHRHIHIHTDTHTHTHTRSHPCIQHMHTHTNTHKHTHTHAPKHAYARKKRKYALYICFYTNALSRIQRHVHIRLVVYCMQQIKTAHL